MATSLSALLPRNTGRDAGCAISARAFRRFRIIDHPLQIGDGLTVPELPERHDDLVAHFVHVEVEPGQQTIADRRVSDLLERPNRLESHFRIAILADGLEQLGNRGRATEDTQATGRVSPDAVLAVAEPHSERV